jgi:hypothetical protein
MVFLVKQPVHPRALLYRLDLFLKVSLIWLLSLNKTFFQSPTVQFLQYSQKVSLLSFMAW